MSDGSRSWRNYGEVRESAARALRARSARAHSRIDDFKRWTEKPSSHVKDRGLAKSALIEPKEGGQADSRQGGKVIDDTLKS